MLPVSGPDNGQSPLCHGLAVVLALIAVPMATAWPHSAASQTPSGQGVTVPGAAFVTARGVTVRTPPVQSLDCAQMRGVLEAIDDSGYRGRGPEPVNSADRDLLDYENRLSGRYYETCVQKPARAEPLGTAFARGYDAPP